LECDLQSSIALLELSIILKNIYSIGVIRDARNVFIVQATGKTYFRSNLSQYGRNFR